MKVFLLVLVLGLLNVFSVFSMGGAPRGEMYGYGSPTSSIMSFLPLVFLIIVIIIGGKSLKNQILVLVKFNLNEDEEEFLKIEGRAAGNLNWIMSLCGINPITSMSCNKESIKFEEGSIRNGKTTLRIPLVSVTGVSSGINKPFSLLVIGILLCLAGIVGAIASRSIGLFMLGLVIGGLFVVFYVLKKTMTFSIYNGGDKPIATIHMKKSIIEGQSIDEEKFELAATALNNVVLKIHKK